MPVEDFLALSGRFSSFSSNSRKREKTRGKTENSFRMKKRLPNLSSAVILPLLSYLAQSPTGRCQSGRMSTPGKCVYRKPVPRVRIPPCPPSIFHRNMLYFNILRFLFVEVWGKLDYSDGGVIKSASSILLKRCDNMLKQSKQSCSVIKVEDFNICISSWDKGFLKPVQAPTDIHLCPSSILLKVFCVTLHVESFWYFLVTHK